MIYSDVVRDGRLELPTSCSQSKRATNCANPGFLVIEFCARCGQTCGQAVFLTTSTCGGNACIVGISRDCGPDIFRLEGGAARSQSKRATNCANPGFLVIQFCTRCGQTCGQAVFLTTLACGGNACIAGVSMDCEDSVFRLEGGVTRSQSKRATNCANPGYEIQTDPTAGCSNSGVCLQMATPQNLTAVHVACRKRTECRRKTILYFTEICRKVKSYIEEAPCPYGHGALILATAAAIAAAAVVAAAPTAAAAAAPDDDQQNDDPAAVPAASATVITAHIGTSYEIEM